jgi:hypothetical protein
VVSPRRKTIRITALLVVLLYVVLRFFVVQATLQEYGVNSLVFLSIDVITAVFYVLGIEELVWALKVKLSLTRVVVWGTVAVIAFAAPYVYLYAAGQAMPPSIFIGMGIIIGLLGVNAFVAIRRRVRSK